jgi:hypothetical protein
VHSHNSPERFWSDPQSYEAVLGVARTARPARRKHLQQRVFGIGRDLPRSLATRRSSGAVIASAVRRSGPHVAFKLAFAEGNRLVDRPSLLRALGDHLAHCRCAYICTPIRAGAGEAATDTITSPRGGKWYNVPFGGSASAHTGESNFSNGGTSKPWPAASNFRSPRASTDRAAGFLPPICRHLQLIAERGRMGWQRASGYNWRALVEADIGRYKRVIGDALRSPTGGQQMTEVAIAAASLTLNRMLELGRPEYVRLT